MGSHSIDLHRIVIQHVSGSGAETGRLAQNSAEDRAAQEPRLDAASVPITLSLVPVHKYMFLLAEVGRIGAEGGAGAGAIGPHLPLGEGLHGLDERKRLNGGSNPAISQARDALADGQSQVDLSRAKRARL